MNKIHYKRRGFTIVELTIAIAVIAILMTITVVAYTGVQRKARNAQTASAVTEYKKALILYRSINKQYPSTPTFTSGMHCLGTDYPGGTCLSYFSANPALTQALQQVAGGKLNMPASAPKGLKGAGYVRDILGTPITLDGVPASFIVYAIEGDARCPVGPVTSVVGGDLRTHSSTPPTSGQTIPIDSDGTVECWLSLPNK